MIPIQNGEDHGFDPTPTREHMRRVGRDAAVNPGGDLSAPSDAQDQRYMRDRMKLLHGHGHDTPPVMVSS